MGSLPRVLPRLTELNRFFWTSGEAGVLQLLRCDACGYYVHPPVPICPRCSSTAVAPAAVSGRGTLFSYTMNHHQWRPGDAVPYLIALVELEEQPNLRLTTNLIECDEADVVIGMAVEVRFEHVEDVWIPIFAPMGGAATAQR